MQKMKKNKSIKTEISF